LERIFGPAETNADVFEELEHLLLSALSGKIATIFAYGASGTGKSHTLSYQQNENSQDPDRDGIIPRLIAMMFKHAEEEQAVSSYQFSLSATEIYLDDMYDLLSRHRVAPKIALGEESWVEVADWISANTVIARVSEKRQQAETKVNVRSSRSHLTLRFRIQRTSVNNDDDRCVFGQINIVDLAGSESISDKTGQRHAEGQSINKSLGDLVSILEQLGKGQRPYPTTTLGKTLRAAFEKPAKVAMLITVSPLKKGYPSTRATLRTAETAHKARKDPLARPRTRK
ncbi:P-loop containing nucleoside triphosphate hydrolase protein, partial [Truncatella angustata]